MNQILAFKKSHRNKFYVLLISSIILFLILLTYLFYYMYNLYKRDNFAKSLSKNINISTLYTTNETYIAKRTNNMPYMNSPFVIGVIEIDSIKLHYPILSYATVESLKIAPCRFAGPNPNEVGNLCIAGHNYIDNTFFGKISILDIGDEMKLYDLNGNMLKYIIDYKGEVEPEDFSCTSQDTKGEKKVTLMTCNTLKNTRIILTAKEAI